MRQNRNVKQFVSKALKAPETQYSVRADAAQLLVIPILNCLLTLRTFIVFF